MSDGLKLLGGILDNGSISSFRSVQRDLLIDDEIVVYDYVRNHLRRYRELPTVQTVEGDTSISIPEAPETYEFYLHKVQDRRLYEQLRFGFNELKRCLREFDMDGAKEVVDAMRSSTREANTTRDLLTLDEAIEDVLAEYEIAHQNPGVSGVVTGWTKYDNLIGGYQPGDLITFVGRPEMGKTWVLLRQAYGSWSAGYSVLMVSMEMTVTQLARRMLGLPSHLNPNLIRRGALSVYAERRLRDVIGAITGGRRFKMFSGGMRKRTSDMEMVIDEYRPDIVYADAVYLMQPSSETKRGKTERTSDTIDDIKQMTLSQSSPIVISTQFNRVAGKKGKDGTLENIAYTDAISTHSSIIVSVQPGSAPYEETRRRLEFIKGREGEKGIVDIHFEFSPMNLDELTPEETAQATPDVSDLDWMHND